MLAITALLLSANHGQNTVMVRLLSMKEDKVQHNQLWQVYQQRNGLNASLVIRLTLL